jgi:hypothetical protein
LFNWTYLLKNEPIQRSAGNILPRELVTSLLISSHVHKNPFTLETLAD